MADKINIILDASKFDLFNLCEARFDYAHNKKKHLPVIQKAEPLDHGNLVHVANESYYEDLRQQKHFNDRVHNAILKLRAAASNPSESPIDHPEARLLEITMEQYFEYWRFEDEHLIIHEVERAFAFPLFENSDLRIIWSGKIDLLVDISPLGRSSGYTNLPIDHKSYKRDYPLTRMTNQFTGYAAATGSNYLLVNRIGLHDPEVKEPKTPEEKFKRVPLSYDPLVIQQWKDNVISVVLNRYLDCVARDSWAMNWTSCLKFNRQCEYFDVCDSSGEEAKLFKLESHYVTGEEWDVTKALKGDN